MSCPYAAVTVERDAPYSAARARVEGRRSPCPYVPALIWSLIDCTIRRVTPAWRNWSTLFASNWTFLPDQFGLITDAQQGARRVHAARLP
jgi:hypothetical protein